MAARCICIKYSSLARIDDCSCSVKKKQNKTKQNKKSPSTSKNGWFKLIFQEKSVCLKEWMAVSNAFLEIICHGNLKDRLLQAVFRKQCVALTKVALSRTELLQKSPLQKQMSTIANVNCKSKCLQTFTIRNGQLQSLYTHFWNCN